MHQTEFNKIYQEHFPKVMRLCMGYTNGNESQAQDLAQEVFVKVWENIKGFRNQSSLSTWIYRITVNTCLINIRRRARLKVSNSQVIEVGEEPDDRTENREIQFEQLYSCIDKLSPNSKAIILLELEGLPQKEIAQIIGIKHEAIRVRLHRIKKELTKCVKKNGII